MESVEALIAAGYTPQRTLIMSFGFDEEISGREGAGHLAPYLLEKYGKVGMLLNRYNATSSRILGLYRNYCRRRCRHR